MTASAVLQKGTSHEQTPQRRGLINPVKDGFTGGDVWRTNPAGERYRKYGQGKTGTEELRLPG